MANITEERSLIQLEETAPQAAVSESTMTRVGANINFINLRQNIVVRSVMQGPYNIIPPPQILMDGIFSFPFPFEISQVILSTGTANGTGGTCEIDVKWRPRNSGAWSSIFSTTPKFAGGAGPMLSVGIGQTAADMIAPVLSKSTFNAFDQIRVDLLQAPVGVVDSTTIETFWRPI